MTRKILTLIFFMTLSLTLEALVPYFKLDAGGGLEFPVHNEAPVVIPWEMGLESNIGQNWLWNFAFAYLGIPGILPQGFGISLGGEYVFFSSEREVLWEKLKEGKVGKKGNTTVNYIHSIEGGFETDFINLSRDEALVYYLNPNLFYLGYGFDRQFKMMVQPADRLGFSLHGLLGWETETLGEVKNRRFLPGFRLQIRWWFLESAFSCKGGDFLFHLGARLETIF